MALSTSFPATVLSLRIPKHWYLRCSDAAGPAWLVKEGIVVPFHAEKSMVALAEKLAEEQPELAAYPQLSAGVTPRWQTHCALAFPPSRFTGFGPKGEAPYWHMVEDTFDKMDPEIMRRNYAFTWQYIRLIDATVKPQGGVAVNYLAFYKPYEVLSQFTDSAGTGYLKDYIHIPGVYAAGRLDYRSEGLLVLSDDGVFIHRLSDPRYDHQKSTLHRSKALPRRRLSSN